MLNQLMIVKFFVSGSYALMRWNLVDVVVQIRMTVVIVGGDEGS